MNIRRWRLHPYYIRPIIRGYFRPSPYSMEHREQLNTRYQQVLREQVAFQHPDYIIPTVQMAPLLQYVPEQEEVYNVDYTPDDNMKEEAFESTDSETSSSSSATAECEPNGYFEDPLGYCLGEIRPVSAMDVINEMFVNPACEYAMDGDSYLASLTLDGKRHIGRGITKTEAQAAAGDVAIREMVVRSFEPNRPADSGVREVPVQLLLGYALYKLVQEWDPSGALVARFQGGLLSRFAQQQQQQQQSGNCGVVKPMRTYQPHPEYVHPVELLAQTYPTASYDVLSISDVPNVSCTVQCTVGEKLFTGVGHNKKEAKKLAAMQACEELLDVSYGATKNV